MGEEKKKFRSYSANKICNHLLEDVDLMYLYGQKNKKWGKLIDDTTSKSDDTFDYYEALENGYFEDEEALRRAKEEQEEAEHLEMLERLDREREQTEYDQRFNELNNSYGATTYFEHGEDLDRAEERAILDDEIFNW